MRDEIKFRGQRVDNGELVYGVPVNSVNDITYIIRGATEDAINTLNSVDFFFTQVKPETVGQFIGLFNNNPVYEGDTTKDGVIEYHPQVCSYIIRRKNGTFIRLEVRKHDIEIIGNIYQNHDLTHSELIINSHE